MKTPEKPKHTEEDRKARIEWLSSEYELHKDGTISFDRACEGEHDLLGQYAAAYIDGFGGKPVLAGDLVTGDPARWHSLRITPEDFLEFEDRLNAHKQEEMARFIGGTVNSRQ